MSLLPIVLMLAGLAFVIAEVFFVSFGLLSLIALVLILGADALAFQHSTTYGWTLVVLQVILVPVLIRLAFFVLPRLPFGRRMLLTAPVTKPGAGLPDLETLVGRRGRALSDLRPSGTAQLDDVRVSVVATGGLIPRDAPIVVVEVEGSEVRVRAASSPTADRVP